jgi:DHA3 family multidrug efflux protein-like MFS transporter
MARTLQDQTAPPATDDRPHAAAPMGDGVGASNERAFSGATTNFLWFALTFWVYLETRSVVATSVIGGAFAAASAVLGVAFGTFVDRHRKKTAMLLSSVIASTCFAAATSIYLTVGSAEVLGLRSVWFWLLITLTLTGSVAGNMRAIALSTCVTLLVAESRRDRANGQVGMITGVGFALTSVFSGLVVGRLGMGWAFIGGVVLMALAAGHLTRIPIHEPEPDRQRAGDTSAMDLRGAFDAVRAVPGLMMLILFAACNNLLAGVFMSLMDAYGLSLVSVEVWGALFGVLSLGFIIGGLIVARRGLGRSPLRLIMAGNLVNWTICSVFALRSSIVPLAIGMFVWLVSIPIIEAAEQTVLQQTVPFERQGRVFGFAQTVENAASPLTSFLIGPIAEAVFIPFMTKGSGVELIGGWFGTGTARGIALIFTLAGVIGVAATLAMRSSRSYRLLASAVGPHSAKP